MYAYAFEHTSKEYLYPVYVDKNPAQPETYLLPSDTTLVAPPSCGEKERPVWNGSSWEIVEDHRRHLDSTGTYTGGTPYWPAGSTYKDEPSYMAELGPIPEGASLTRPEKTEEEIQTEQLKSTIQESQAYLNSTDYQVIKFMDNYIKTHSEALAEFEKKYPNTLAKRQEARDNINSAQSSASAIGVSLWNINGGIIFNKDRNVLEETVDGCFESTVYGYNTWALPSTSNIRLETIPRNIKINVSKVVPTSKEVRPYSVKMLYLIAY